MVDILQLLLLSYIAYQVTPKATQEKLKKKLNPPKANVYIPEKKFTVQQIIDESNV